MDLKDARALVTGGGSGIGLATARAIIEGGGQAVICGRREDVLHAAAADIGATAIVADVAKEEDVEHLVVGSIAALGGLNVLINNAAYGYHAKLLDVDTAKFRAVFETNVVGAMMVGRACAQHFADNGGGTILNVGSTSAQRGYAGGTPYSATKFALRSMTECWRAELRPLGIRVMEIDPSEVQTPFGGRDMSTLNPTKLEAGEIAHMIKAMLEMDDRGFVTTATVWATNPQG